MTYEEDQILKYLESVKDYVSVREIGRRVGGRVRFQKDPNWAKPLLLNLMKEDWVEMDLMGHFRAKPPKTKKEETPAAPQNAETVEPSAKEAEPSGTDSEPSGTDSAPSGNQPPTPQPPG